MSSVQKNKWIQNNLRLPVAASFLLILYGFWGALAGLWQGWQADEYSHGPLIPVIALLIGWHRLTEKAPKPIPSPWGLPLLLAGFASLAVAQLSAFEPPSHYGFVLALVGWTWLFGGAHLVKTLAPAFLYLVFAIPLPRLVYVGLSGELQLLSSTLGVLPLEWLGIPVFQDGNVIDLGGMKLQVVEACNGLRYLFPLMSFGFLVAYLLRDRFWKRAILFLSTIPLAILMNALRISVIGITVSFWGQEMAEGLLHDFEGWSVFIVCLVALFAETWLLMRLGDRGHLRLEILGPAKGPLFAAPPPQPRWQWLAAVLILSLALPLGMGTLQNRQEIIPSHRALALFPLTLDSWQGRNTPMGSEILTALGLDDYWSATYRRENDSASVDLYIAYYASQRMGSTIHSPANCLPGSGWKIETKSIAPVSLNGITLPVTRMLIRKGRESMLVYYWFDQRGRILNEQYGAKWYLLVDSIRLHRTDGALIRVGTALSPLETESDADKRLSNFLTSFYPEIKGFVPQ